MSKTIIINVRIDPRYLAGLALETQRRAPDVELTRSNLGRLAIEAMCDVLDATIPETQHEAIAILEHLSLINHKNKRLSKQVLSTLESESASHTAGEALGAATPDIDAMERELASSLLPPPNEKPDAIAGPDLGTAQDPDAS